MLTELIFDTVDSSDPSESTSSPGVSEDSKRAARTVESDAYGDVIVTSFSHGSSILLVERLHLCLVDLHSMLASRRGPSALQGIEKWRVRRALVSNHGNTRPRERLVLQSDIVHGRSRWNRLIEITHRLVGFRRQRTGMRM